MDSKPVVLPRVPHQYRTVIDKALVDATNVPCDWYDEGTSSIPVALPRSSTNPAQIYQQCLSLIEEIKHIIKEDLIENHGVSYREEKQVDFLDRLGECHMLACTLPSPFRSQMYQEEANVLMAAIGVMDRQLTRSIKVKEPDPKTYLLLNNTRDDAISFYHDHLENLSSQQPKFTERDQKADFKTMLSHVARYPEAWQYGWDDLNFLAGQSFEIPADQAQAMIVAARGPELQKLYDHYKDKQDWHAQKFAQEAEELGIVLEGNVPVQKLSTEIKNPVLDGGILSVWEQMWNEYAPTQDNTFFPSEFVDTIAQVSTEGVGTDLLTRYENLVTQVVLYIADEYKNHPSPTLEIWHVKYALYSMAPLAPYVKDPQSFEASIRSACTNFFDQDIKSRTENDGVLDISDLQSFGFNYVEAQEALRKISPNAFVLDAATQASLIATITTLGEAALPDDTQFSFWLEMAQAATPITPGIGDVITTLMAQKISGTASISTVTTAKQDLPEDWNQIVTLAQEYNTTLWSYTSAANTGFNLLYGPLCDVARKDGQGYMEKGGRVFSHDPEVTATLALLTVKATRQNNEGVGFVLKHAPVIGYVTENPEWKEMQIDYRNKDAILTEFSAFQRAFQEQEQMAVMVSGVAYPALETDAGTIKPGTLSPAVCGMVRSSLGPDTVLFSDDLGTPAFTDYFKRQGTPTDALGHYAIPAIVQATKAGIDVCLLYARDPSFLDKMLGELTKATEAGVVPMEELEASVLRILKYKKRLFPNAAILADPEGLVKKMSTRELWAQKIVFPCHALNDANTFLHMGVGGLTFEGIQRPSYYINLVARETAANPGMIPPFLANNSPQETGDKTSAASTARTRERDILRELASRLEKDYPEGVPPEIADRLVEEALAR